MPKAIITKKMLALLLKSAGDRVRHQRHPRSTELRPPKGRCAPMLDLSDVALRLGAATAIGILIGLNRGLADKPIGMRTLSLVTLGAASAAVTAVQVPGMDQNPDAMSRVVQGVIQGVMAGISFIGAGVILRNAEARTVGGQTTAASVWVAAALGIALGLGMWNVVTIGAALAVAARRARGRLIGVKKAKRTVVGQEHNLAKPRAKFDGQRA